MARRWVCPACGGGVNGPDRPRRDDVRRYCLTCSVSTGRLVERVAPALERQRAASAARSAEKAKVRRIRRESKWRIACVDAAGREIVIDVRTETRRALRAMGVRSPDAVTMGVYRTAGYSGHAEPWSSHIHYSIKKRGPSAERVLELIYHEAAHIAAGSDPSDRLRWHGENFRRTLAEAVQKRWPFVTYGSTRDAGGAYAADRRVVAQLQDHVRAGGSL